MKEPCIQVSGLTKAFHGRKVVDDLSFRVEPGEVFALLTLILITLICGTIAVKTFRWE